MNNLQAIKNLLDSIETPEFFRLLAIAAQDKAMQARDRDECDNYSDISGRCSQIHRDFQDVL